MFRLQTLAKSFPSVLLALLLIASGCGSSTAYEPSASTTQDSAPTTPEYNSASSEPSSAPPSAQTPSYTAPEEPSQPEVTASPVYVTRTGAKYHRGGCQYLRRSQIAITRADAEAQYSACSVCNP